MSPKKDVLLTKLYFKLEGFCSFMWGGTRIWPTIVKNERFGEAQAGANCYVCLDVCMDVWMDVCMDVWMYMYMYALYARDTVRHSKT